MEGQEVRRQEVSVNVALTPTNLPLRGRVHAGAPARRRAARVLASVHTTGTYPHRIAGVFHG